MSIRSGVMKLIDRGNISCRVEVIVWSFVELDQMYDRVADEKEWVENKFGQGKLSLIHI